MECAGILAIAIRKDVFYPIWPFFMERTQNGLIQPGLDKLQDYTYGFFANIVEMMGADFKEHPLVLMGCTLQPMESFLRNFMAYNSKFTNISTPLVLYLFHLYDGDLAACFLSVGSSVSLSTRPLHA